MGQGDDQEKRLSWRADVGFLIVGLFILIESLSGEDPAWQHFLELLMGASLVLMFSYALVRRAVNSRSINDK